MGEPAERGGVDRATVGELRDVGRQGALEDLAASRPARMQTQRDAELEAALAEVDR
ncbi:hypothetical protein [Iamia sp.]|uniref:hypothetical protein n=1 Tax=Iamia sp. TaxID=2722710 RepID=UPI002B5A9A23|nr:hypothetical protein [Iamia sp.]HXH58590.1 hypothetical protein [Iamia sp.]